MNPFVAFTSFLILMVALVAVCADIYGLSSQRE